MKTLQTLPWACRSSFNISVSVLAMLLAASTIVPQAHAQTFTVLHTFEGAPTDGGLPMEGVVMDRIGNLYGVTISGGTFINGCTGFGDGGCGTVFKLTRHGSSWLYSVLYKFQGPPDGNYPAGVVVGPDSTLYGMTGGGGLSSQQTNCNDYSNGCGVVFRVRPPATFCSNAVCPWNESVLYTFTGHNGDGGNPSNGDLIFDSAGNIFGTTPIGGATNYGTAFKLSPSQGGWTENIFYNFDPTQQQIGNPNTGLLADQAGHFYGSSGYSVDGNPSGGVYELTQTQSGWTANALQIFNCVGGLNGCYPADLMFDSAGNLILANTSSGFYRLGTVIELLASDNWSVDLLYTFHTGQGYPANRLAMDAAGNIYGTDITCATGYGCIFKLTPTDGGYVYTDLYDFTGRSDGEKPYGGVVIDAQGNLYGTAMLAGDLRACFRYQNGCGTVWELTP
ncbi:MAG TPA: choice-of-anchor tandem repeat GloVer-containing protein [Terriglobales bacterium]|nr:choice-of-anchor tandem repeat GloVer-containing protein [Terriglobales bacterium]